MSYRGVSVEIPTGLGSLDDRDNWRIVPPDNLSSIQNVMYEGGSYRKMPGVSAPQLDLGNNTVIRGVRQYFTGGNNNAVAMLIATGNNLIHVDAGNNQTVAANNLTTQTHGVLIQGGKETGKITKVFFINGYDAPRVVIGQNSTANNFTVPAPEWTTGNGPSAGAMHGRRLWLTGCPAMPHMVWGSGFKDQTDFQCADSVFYQTGTGVGERCAALAEIGKRLVVFKHPVGIYVLNDSALREIEWSLQRITDEVGVADTPYAVLTAMGDAVFLSADGGLHVLSQTGEGEGNVRRSDLAEALHIKKYLQETVQTSLLHKAVSFWSERTSEAVFYLPRKSSNQVDLRLSLDFTRYLSEGRVQVSTSILGAVTAVGVNCSGSNDTQPPRELLARGQTLHYGQQNDRSNAGNGYIGSYRTATTDFAFLDGALRGTGKRFDALELHMLPQGAGSNNTILYADIYVDGALRKTLEFNPSLNRQTRTIGLHGYTYSHVIRDAGGNGKDFAVIGQVLYMTRGARRL